jgi:mannose-6-phosphate isomerase-like protein (cupin superfamily)
MSDNMHAKGWGYELWIHNDEKYCGKLLAIFAGKKCSLHYHKLKHETFYLQQGRLRVYMKYADGTEKTFIMEKGQTQEVPPGTIHQMYAIEYTELFEFSTQHFDSDSYRIEKGD